MLDQSLWWSITFNSTASIDISQSLGNIALTANKTREKPSHENLFTKFIKTSLKSFQEMPLLEQQKTFSLIRKDYKIPRLLLFTMGTSKFSTNTFKQLQWNIRSLSPKITDLVCLTLLVIGHSWMRFKRYLHCAGFYGICGVILTLMRCLSICLMHRFL